MQTQNNTRSFEPREVVVSRGGWREKPVVFKKDLTGHVIIVTGASSGLGKQTARGLAKTGATIILACRNQTKTLPVIDELKAESHNQNIEFMQLDLADLSSIREFAEEFKNKYQRLDVLINNAGLGCPDRRLTKDGFELTFATNHLGPFYLTTLLLDVLKKSAPSRVINVSSLMHKFGKMNWDDLSLEKDYNFNSSYAQSKLANNLFTKELQKRLQDSNVKVVTVSPWIAKTEGNTNYGPNYKWYFRLSATIVVSLLGTTAEEGARTALYCALEDHEKLNGGAYYEHSKIANENPAALKEEDWTRLWEESEKMIQNKLIS